MPKRTVQFAWDASYRLSGCENPKELVLMLHGFQQDCNDIFDHLASVVSETSIAVCPNAPFPIPRRATMGYSLGFSWYFFDPETERYLMDMKVAVEFLGKLLWELGLHELPTRVVGFSQGGYLAPFLAEVLPGMKQAVAINGRFRDEALGDPGGFRLDAINGERDRLVDPYRARISHETLMARGWRGEFHLVPGLGHSLTAEVRPILQRILSLE